MILAPGHRHSIEGAQADAWGGERGEQRNKARELGDGDPSFHCQPCLNVSAEYWETHEIGSAATKRGSKHLKEKEV